MDGYINKRELMQNITLSSIDYDTKQIVRAYIERAKEVDLLERDMGKEPILESGTSVYHECLANGTGRFVRKDYLDWKCPVCGWFVGELYSGHGMWHIQGETSYCSQCGQKIDWSKPSAEEKQRYEECKAEERKAAELRGHKLDNMWRSKREKYGVMEHEQT